MQSSEYFRKSIYYEQSPAALNYWEARVQSIFVTDDSQSWLDAYLNTAFRLALPADDLDSQPLAGISLSHDHLDSHHGSLNHKDVAQEIPQSTVLLSGDGKRGQKNEGHDGLHLQKVRHKSELLQLLSVWYLPKELVFIAC